VDLHVAFQGRANLARQIYQQVQAAVLEGRLRPGDLLPPSRELAVRLDVSRTTVSAAYERLAVEGFVTTRTGAGTYVSSLSLPAPAEPHAGSPAPHSPLRGRDLWDEIPVPPPLTDEPPFDFRVGVTDTRLFPYSTWRRLVARQLRQSAVGTGMPTEPAGHPALRAAIARHAGIARNVRTAAEDVLVTSGSQQAIDLVGRVLLEPGACVAVEEPGYTTPRLLFTSLGARVVGVPVDEEGLVVDALPAAARLVYVTPSHQMPTGVAMSLRRRMALLSWAASHDAAVVEDDYDTEFRYAGRSLEPLHSLDRAGRVLYVGSFSKVLLPTLRLGFLVAPPSLRHPLQAAKFVADWHTSLPIQTALAEFIDEGGLAAHIRRMRAVYRARHDLIVAALSGPLAPWLELIPSTVGLHVGAYLRDRAAEKVPDLLDHARQAGVGIFGFDQVATGATRPGLAFGYGGIPADHIPEGIRRLSDCLRD
jgi:GntR family transcriptional regulator/MocR family aminotransferase